MDARSFAQWIVASIVTVAGFCLPVFADTVYAYVGDNLSIPSPDDPWSEYGKGWMDDAVIEIYDHHTISDLDVHLTLTHESLFDLQIFLQSPAGTNVLLSPSGNLAFIVRGEDGRLTAYGGSVDWFFDDEAEASIEEAIEPYNGPYQPVELLSAFDGEDVFGEWRLRIYDAFDAHTGTLDSFELIITTPEPATAVFFMLGAGLVTLFRPCRRP